MQIQRFLTFLGVCVAGLTLMSRQPAGAAIISVNLTPFSEDASNVDSDEVFGIASEGTVVGGWLNFNQSGGGNLQGPLNDANLPFSDGSLSTVDMTLTAPNAWSTFNAAYDDTPLKAGLDDYTGTANPTSVILTDLTNTFPSGYKIIVYVGGFNGNRGASISDGTSTYYYQPIDSPTAPVTFVRTTDTTDDGDDTAPEAQYAVFGDSTLLTSNTLTLTINTLYGGGSGLCGFQLIGQAPSDELVRIWSGDVNSDWDDSTLNWTNDFFGATNYADGDTVIFNDTPAGTSHTVNLTGTRSPGRVLFESTDNYTLSGSDIAGAIGLLKRGSGILTLNNANTYTGDTDILGGTLRVGAGGAIPDGAGKGDLTLEANATLDLNGVSEGINGLSGSGTIDNTAAGPATLTVGNDDDDMVFPGVLQSTVGALSLAKTGTNTLVLTGANSHTGATLVQEGTLSLVPASSFSSASAVVLSNNATLALDISDGFEGIDAPSVSLHGGTLQIEYGDAQSTGFSTPVFTGTLNLEGVSQIGISGENFEIGTYTLISFTSRTGAGSIDPTPAFLPSGMVATIVETAFSIDLEVTSPSVRSLLWVGGSGVWSTNTGLFNWTVGDVFGPITDFEDGDAVRFENIDFGTVTVAHDVFPASVTVDGPYVLTGSGAIAGSTGVEKTGSGTTFAIDNANSYDGVTTVSQGTLLINNAGALGSTAGATMVTSGNSLALSNAVTLSGEPITLTGNGPAPNLGALRSLDANNPVTVDAPITLADSARIRAGDGTELIITGSITDNGSNHTVFLHAGQPGTVLRMNSSGNVAGAVTVYGNKADFGVISFGANNVFPGSQLNVGGGLHDLNGTAQEFAGLDAGFAPENGVITNSSAIPSTLTTTVGSNSVQLLTPIRGNVSLVKEGPGLQSFGGGSGVAHTYSGTTTVNEGILGIACDLSGVTNSFTVNAGGTLRGSQNTIGGPVSINAGGTIYAGFASNAVGTLTISNDLTLAGNLVVAVNKDEVQSNDVIQVTGALSYGGTLTILNTGTNALEVGDTFTVFPAGGSGNFASIDSSAVPGVTFSFLDGVLTVDSVVTVGPTLDYTPLGGGVVRFEWTGDYKLQSQTNALDTGLGTNWMDYPDTSNPVNVTNDPAIPASFFRLKSLL